VSLAWKVVSERIQNEFGTVHRDEAMRLVGPDDTYLQFLEKSQESTLVEEKLIPVLRRWIASGREEPCSGDFGKHLQLLVIMKDTL
jgi:hypothetical protein